LRRRDRCCDAVSGPEPPTRSGTATNRHRRPRSDAGKASPGSETGEDRVAPRDPRGEHGRDHIEGAIEVRGESLHNEYRVLTMSAPSVHNALAALLLDIRDRTGVRPHIYFEWTEGNPALHLVRFLLFGVGETAAVTREVVRRAELRRNRRPHIHAG
jgi:hypothetical protein